MFIVAGLLPEKQKIRSVLGQSVFPESKFLVGEESYFINLCGLVPGLFPGT